MKPVDQLSPADLKVYKVWEFATDSESELTDETYVKPVSQLPVDSLDSRLVSTFVTLANGNKALAILGNVDLVDASRNEQFLSITIFSSTNETFHLARYHDVDCARRGAAALASFLGLTVEAVFPIRYDISDVAVGRADCVKGKIPNTPTKRLSKEQLIALALR